MKMFFLSLAIAIVLLKDIFMTKEGKYFVINAIKEAFSGILEKLGYVKSTIKVLF